MSPSRSIVHLAAVLLSSAACGGSLSFGADPSSSTHTEDPRATSAAPSSSPEMTSPAVVEERSLRAVTPRQKAVLLLEGALGEGRIDVARGLISEHYKQHNPRVADGPAGILEMIDYFARHPEARPVVHVVRAITDGDLVVTHSEYVRRGRKIVGVDMFRVDDGKLAEHWDAGMPQPEKTSSGHTLIDGSADNGDTTKTLENKAIVKQFVEEVLIAGKLASADRS